MASKMSKTEWKVLIGINAFLDFIQFVVIELILVWFFGVGVAINAALDPIIGIANIAYLQLRGVSLVKRPQRILSMLGMEFAAQITGGIAQLWFLDIWYIHSDVKKEEAQIQAQKDAQQALEMSTMQQVLNQGGVRDPISRSDSNTKPSPLNINGVRPPTGRIPPPLPSISSKISRVSPTIPKI